MGHPLEFTIALRDFDRSQLPENSREFGTDSFAEAVGAYFTRQFEPLGGIATVSVGEEELHVSWVPGGVSRNPTEQAVSLLREGRHQEAISLLRLLLSVRPDDDVILYNLGMAESDLGELDTAVAHLERAVELDPKDANSLVGLSVAQQRSGETGKAIHSLERAIMLDPDNGYAHRNLGAILGSEGHAEKALRHLRDAARLMPGDQRTVYGLAHGLEHSGDQERLAEADRLYQQVIGIDAASDIAELARRARSGLAQKGFRSATGMPVRMDAVMYCLGALQKYAKMTPEQVQSVAFEIALLGRRGLDINNPASAYTLRSLPGTFSGLHLMSLMYVGFKQMAPEQEIGFDLNEEYRLAQDLHGSDTSGEA